MIRQIDICGDDGMAKYLLGDIAPICQGAVPSSNQYWLLNLDMVESNTGSILDYVYVDDSQIGASTVSFDTRNVLYSKLRPYLNKVVLPDRAGYATSEMIPLKPDETIVVREYLTYFLRSPHFVNYINEKTSGAKMPRANISDLKAYEIDCPSVMEQQKIVSQFDSLRRIIQVPQQQLSALDELINARFVEMFGSIKEEQLLKNISEFVTVGIANSATHAYAEAGIPMLRNQNIKENYLDDTDLIYIKPEFAAKYESKKLKENDIIAMRTGYPGIACLVPKKYEGCQTFTTLIVRLKAENNPSYVCSYINSDLGKKIIESGKVGVAQQNFGAKALAKMPIKIAPKELQDEYAAFVKQVDKSKFAIQKSLDETQTLFDSLMQQYFG